MEGKGPLRGDENAGVQRKSVKGNVSRPALADVIQFQQQRNKVEFQLKDKTIKEDEQTPEKSKEVEDSLHKSKDAATKKMWSSGNTDDFLAFEPTERPKWREETINDNVHSIPPVSQMVRDILRYQRLYQALKATSEKKGHRKKVLRCLLITFLCNVQKEEDIGVKTEGKTGELMDELDSEIIYTRKGNFSDSTDELYQGQERQGSPEFESFPSLENDLKDILVANPDRVTETKNLYLAYKHIVQELENSESDISTTDSLFDDCKGVIDPLALINNAHRILMADIMKEGQIPGNFSDKERKTTFRDEEYSYPWFEHENIADEAIQTLVDKVNLMMNDIKRSSVAEEEKYKLFFKCSSLFLFGFLTLHPFPDGNGRLARLLASYNLLTFSPFMTPIYNVFSSSRRSDYVQALVDARLNHKLPEKICFKEDAVDLTISIMRQKPRDLCAMLIESNWTIWRQLLLELGDQSIELFGWEIQNQQSLKGLLSFQEQLKSK